MGTTNWWSKGALALLVAALLGGSPADAGKRRKRSRQKPAEPVVTATVTATESKTETKDSPETDFDFDLEDLFKVEDGGINPSSIAVVDDDLTKLAVAAEEPTLVYDLMASYETGRVPAAQLILADAAHKRAQGKGIVVAVLDGGFNLKHPALRNSLSPFMYDVIDGDAMPHDMGNGIDDDRDGIVDNAWGHGTFVAGMVLLAAPKATIMPIRVRDDEGFGADYEVAKGIMYAVDMGADVINLSLSQGLWFDLSLMFALDYAERNGVVVVVSAGNEGIARLDQMAATWTTVCVGATDCCDMVAPFSNTPGYGQSLDVFAPGMDLFGPMGYEEYGMWSGTSFATGLVSGALALLIELEPGESARDLREELREAVDPVYDMKGNLVPYAGRVNLAKLVLDD